MRIRDYPVEFQTTATLPAAPSGSHTGLNYLDYFAGQALIGILASKAGVPEDEVDPEAVANLAWVVAIEMVSRRVGP